MIAAALIVILVVRSLVPAVGVLFLGWPPSSVLLLCFLDTMLGIGAVVVALALFASRDAAKGGMISRLRALLGAVVGAAFVVVLLAIPLGGALVFMLANTDFSVELTLRDWSFQRAVGLQALASIWWCGTLVWQLRTRTLEEVGVKPLFGLIVLRWIVLVAITYTGLPAMLGRGGPYLLVVVYTGTMIFSELNPGRFLKLMSSGRPGRPGSPA